jgi:hypothetical protein
MTIIFTKYYNIGKFDISQWFNIFNYIINTNLYHNNNININVDSII